MVLLFSMKEKSPIPYEAQPENTEALLAEIETNPEVGRWIDTFPGRDALFVLLTSGSVLILPACSSNAPDSKEMQCLAENIFYESALAKQPKEGSRAVALVTLARVVSKQYPNSICAVVHQKRVAKRKVIEKEKEVTKEITVPEFAWTILRKRAPFKGPLATEASAIAAEVYTHKTIDPDLIAKHLAALGLTTDTYFYKRTDDKGVSERSKRWFARRLEEVRPIGDHTFYRAKGPLPKKGALKR